MRIFKEEPKIKFINKRFYAFALSGLIILAGLVLAGLLFWQLPVFRLGRIEADQSGEAVEPAFEFRALLNRREREGAPRGIEFVPDDVRRRGFSRDQNQCRG